MRTSAIIALATAVSVMAQTSPAPGTVLMPYSLEGEWNSPLLPATDALAQTYSGCYQAMTASKTNVVWDTVCLQKGNRQEVTVATVTLASPSTVACGQNQQLGQSYGVFGGYLTLARNNATVGNQTAACVYFSRVDASHLTASDNAVSEMVSYVPTEACPAGTAAGQVCCQAVVPSDHTSPTVGASLDGAFTCASGVCLSDRQSSYCSDNSNGLLKSIAIGMSVGGIGLLLVTLALILVISTVAQG